MRWCEIIGESDDIVSQTRQAILDMVTPLITQGVTSITTKQVMNQLSLNPSLQGIALNDDLISQALNGVANMEIAPNTANGGQMTITFKAAATTPAAQQQSDKGAEKVDQAAMRQASKDIG